MCPVPVTALPLTINRADLHKFDAVAATRFLTFFIIFFFFYKTWKTSHLLATKMAGHKRHCGYVSAVLCLCAYQSSGTSLWLIHKRISGEERAKT